MRFHCDVASDATPHRMDNCDRNFGGACCLHLQSQCMQDILRVCAFGTSITIYQAPYHTAKLECSASRLCHKVVSLRLLICTLKKYDFLRCNRRVHKAVFSVALEIISRMCPLAWPLYVTKHQILETDIISSSRR